MTPAARVQAAIEVLDAMAGGLAAEQALTRWARGARYAGSKDRAAVRDHVFTVLRRKRSCAALGGGDGGRALMLGALRDAGADIDALFTGEGHAPPPLSDAERAAGAAPTAAEERDLPDWIWEAFCAGRSAEAAGEAAEALRHRAPVCLRHNARLKTVPEVVETLSEDGISATPVPGLDGALIVTDGARRVALSRAYREGLVELQDASSQAAMAAVPVPEGARVLDYCAGGGGKVLALAARHDGQWFAHDAAPERMRDLPARAERAGVKVTPVPTAGLSAAAPFDVVLCDVPCSGSGTWRRAPEAKWTLTPERLAELCDMQEGILEHAQALVRPGGLLAYTTCSILHVENAARLALFLAAHSDWEGREARAWPISDSGDGFFLATFRKPV